MRITGLIIAFLSMPALGLAADHVDIDVGGRTIAMPLPDGFVELTPDMSPVYETMRAYVAPTNTRYLTLVPESAAPVMLQGQSVALERYINVESEHGISRMSVSTTQFNELRDVLREQLDELYANVERQMPGLVGAGNARASEQLGANIAVEMGALVPFPVHLDNDHAIANSMYMTVGGAVNEQQVDSSVLAATTLFLHVGDKVVFLYVYGPESDLDWTRDTATAWAGEIRAANASLPTPAGDDGRPAFDWNSILGRAIIGALAGAAIALFAAVTRKRKKNEAAP